MKSFKKYAGLLLSVFMLVSLLAACGAPITGSSAAPTPASSSPTSGPDAISGRLQKIISRGDKR